MLIVATMGRIPQRIKGRCTKYFLVASASADNIAAKRAATL